MAVKNRWLALIGLTISVLVVGFDTTILNVALPTLVCGIAGVLAAALAAVKLPGSRETHKTGQTDEQPLPEALSEIADGARQ